VITSDYTALTHGSQILTMPMMSCFCRKARNLSVSAPVDGGGVI